MKKLNPKTSTFLLLLILATAAGFRFLNLSQQGIFSYDEAWYQLVAQTYLLLPKFIAAVNQGTDPKVAFNEIYNWGFYPHFTFKPTYILLLMLTKAVIGLANPAAGATLSAVLGLGVVGMVFAIVKRMTASPWFALGGALIAAVSGFEVYYSRVGYPHQWAALALLIFVYFYQKRLSVEWPLPMRWVYLLGFGIGALLTAHDMMLPIVALLTLYEVGFLLYKNTWKPSGLKSVPVLVAGLITPGVFWELTSVLARKFFHRTLHKGYVMPYHQEVLGHVGSHPVTVEHYAQRQVDYAYFLKMFSITEGVLFLVFLCLGFIALAATILRRQASAPRFFLAFLAAACLGMITVFPDKMARLASPFMPLFIIVSTLGWAGTATFLARRLPAPMFQPVIAILLLIGISLPAALFSVDLTQLRSGYAVVSRDAARLLKSGETVATPSNAPIYTLYLQRKVHNFQTREDLVKLVADNNATLVVYDREQKHKMCERGYDRCPEEAVRLSRFEDDKLTPFLLKTYPNAHLRQFPLFWEAHYPYETAEGLIRDRERVRLDVIRLYRADKSLTKP